KVNGTPNATLVKPFVEATSLSSHNEVQSAYRMFSTTSEGAELATSAAALAATSAVTAEGVLHINPDIVVGGNVTVSAVGPASGTYSVTEVEHSYTAQGFLTRFVAGDRTPTGLVDS